MVGPNGKKPAIQRSPSVAAMNGSSGNVSLFSSSTSARSPAFPAPGSSSSEKRSSSPNSRRGPAIVASGDSVLDDLFNTDDDAGAAQQANSAKRPGGMVRAASMYSAGGSASGGGGGDNRNRSLYGMGGLGAIAEDGSATGSPRSMVRKQSMMMASESAKNRAAAADSDMKARVAAAKTVQELCDIYGITTTSVFEGGMY